MGFSMRGRWADVCEQEGQWGTFPRGQGVWEG